VVALYDSLSREPEVVVTSEYESSCEKMIWFAVFGIADVTFTKEEPVHMTRLPLALFCDDNRA
jgi:hypothetical protein